MSSEDSHHHHHHHHRTHKVLEKISSKISSLKDDITDAVRERKHSMSSDRRSSMSSEQSINSAEHVTFTLQDDIPSATIDTKQIIRTHEDTDGFGSISSNSLSNSESISTTNSIPITRHGIDQLAINMGFGGMKPSLANPTNAAPLIASKSSSSSLASSISNTSSLLNSSNPMFQPIITPTSSQQQFEFNDNISLNREYSTSTLNDIKERTITKVDPDDMTAKPAVVSVPNDPERRAALLLSGPKFQLKYDEIPMNKLPIDNDTIYSVAIVVGVVSLVIALWKPISTYFSGLIVGILFAGALFYIFVRIFINKKVEETAITEWVEFPSLESMLTKCDREDKNTDIQVTGATMAFQRYDADRDEDFVRYPCDIRLNGYRLIIRLASKQWNDEKKTEKEMKFIGDREYLVKEARMILVPEATLTRAKYWMNDYPIVIQDLQILDKQIYNKQQLEKSKLDTNDFFTNTATVLSIWFETGRQKEEWFHALSLVLRRGKEEIERKNSLISGSSNNSLSLSGSTPSLHRRLAQTDSDTELVPNPVSECQLDQSILETQISAQELQQKAKLVEPSSDEVDASGTHRTMARKSKKQTPNEVSLQKVLQSPECLDEGALTINFMARRLLSDMFDVPLFKDLIKTKVEMKLKEIAVSILENLRVTSIDIGNTFPVILKIEPLQWNTQGIWFNLFVYYRGNFKLSVRTNVLLQKLINYDPKKDKPIFAQHHSAQIVHKDDERIDENDLVQRQKLLAKEPEIPEMAITRKLGLKLTSLALNPYFQMIANIPFVKSLFEKFSQNEVGADIEVTSFSGVLTLNIPPPPSDRIWVGFPEVPDLNIKVVPVYGQNQYAYTLLQDFLQAKIRAELKRLVVLPAMDDQLLPLFRDWVIDIIGEIVKQPVNPETDDYRVRAKAQESVAEGLKEYKTAADLRKQTSTTSSTTSSTNETYL